VTLTVLVDATTLDGHPSGAATRLRALGEAHARRGAVRVVHLVRPETPLDPLPGLETRPFRGMTTPLSRSFAARRLAAVRDELGAAVVHAGALPLPAPRAGPLVLTIHDLRFLEPGAGASPARRLWGRYRLRPNLSRASRVVAVSRTTADALASRGLVPADRVAVIPNAPTPWLSPEDDPQRLAGFRRRTELNARYLLAVGPLATHKRTGLLLDVLAALHRRPACADVGLVVAGRLEPPRALPFMRRAKAMGLDGHVRLVGPLDDEHLSIALSGADALVVPSVAEGFSLPVTDAQVFGVPVVAARAGALPEVGGEGAWYAEPGDAEAFAAVVAEAVTPSDEREARLQAGRAAASRWSWDASAAALEELWREVAAGG
jgi:glycosyltransferase involved in cell wall biosynthesis